MPPVSLFLPVYLDLPPEINIATRLTFDLSMETCPSLD
jgi:hypothetical protein